MVSLVLFNSVLAHLVSVLAKQLAFYTCIALHCTSDNARYVIAGLPKELLDPFAGDVMTPSSKAHEDGWKR